MRPLRVIDTGLATARANIAISGALLRKRQRDPSRDILRFYRFHPCVLIGDGAAAEVPAAATRCRRAGIEVAVRLTGGGAVYMSDTMLAWDFVTRPRRSVAATSSLVGCSVARALRRFGVAAEFQPPYGVTAGDRKVSGAAAVSYGAILLHQGTLLLTDETAPMASALGLALPALRAAVASVDRHCATMPTAAAIMASVTGEIAAAFELMPENAVLEPDEARAAAEELPVDRTPVACAPGRAWSGATEGAG